MLFLLCVDFKWNFVFYVFPKYLCHLPPIIYECSVHSFWYLRSGKEPRTKRQGRDMNTKDGIFLNSVRKIFYHPKEIFAVFLIVTTVCLLSLFLYDRLYEKTLHPSGPLTHFLCSSICPFVGHTTYTIFMTELCQNITSVIQIWLRTMYL